MRFEGGNLFSPVGRDTVRFFPSSLVVCVFLCGGANTLMAQQQAMPRELLLFKEVSTVVSATGREQPLTQSPSAITVITAEEIRHSGATSLPELLRGVPGLDLFRTSASGVSIAARGLNLEDRSRIQVLIDGLSVYEDVSAVLFWHQIPIPLDEIERIEIVRSPATALYGDKAFAGVVHILTKSPEALQGTQVSGTLGDAGTGIVNLIHAGVAGNLSYKASMGYDRTEQFPNPAVGRAHGELGRADTRGHFQVNYTLPQGSQVALSGGIDAFDRREVLPAGPFQAVVAGGLSFLKASYAVGDFKAQLSYNRFDVDIRSESFFEDIAATVNVYQVKLQHSLALGRTNVLTGEAPIVLSPRIRRG
ncbi:MAG: TonB-dependent receptor [Nitrospinae bacterium]|nr:TonB-dependent receptor [Nitrospinota bacterium]